MSGSEGTVLSYSGSEDERRSYSSETDGIALELGLGAEEVAVEAVSLEDVGSFVSSAPPWEVSCGEIDFEVTDADSKLSKLLEASTGRAGVAELKTSVSPRRDEEREVGRSTDDAGEAGCESLSVVTRTSVVGRDLPPLSSMTRSQIFLT